jgi:predicted deacylase
MNLTQGLSCSLDLASDGKRIGTVDLAHSDNNYAFDTIPIPIAVIANGNGPTVLLSAGVHGDEYEGQVILRHLIQELEPDRIKGRLIILPALNYPAMLDDARVSPLDRGNLNRAFPGRDDGGPTSAIAHFVTTSLLPQCDAGIDLHSGGRASEYIPSAFLCLCRDKEVFQKSLEMADSFAAPYTLVVDGNGAPGGFDPAAHRAGVPFLSAELSGGGGVDRHAVDIGSGGVRRVLAMLGVLADDVPVAASPTQFVSGLGDGHMLRAPMTGIFEGCVGLADMVERGQPAGRVYPLEDVAGASVEMVFESGGIVFVRRVSARVRYGSHVYEVVSKMTRDDVLRRAHELT